MNMNFKIELSDEVKKKLIGAFWTGIALGLQHIASESIKNSGKGVGSKVKSVFSKNDNDKETDAEFEFFNINMLEKTTAETRICYLKSSIQNMLANYTANKKLDSVSLKKNSIFVKYIYKIKDSESIMLLNDFIDICNMIKTNNIEYLDRFKEKYDVKERMELCKAIS